MGERTVGGQGGVRDHSKGQGGVTGEISRGRRRRRRRHPPQFLLFTTVLI